MECNKTFTFKSCLKNNNATIYRNAERATNLNVNYATSNEPTAPRSGTRKVSKYIQLTIVLPRVS